MRSQSASRTAHRSPQSLTTGIHEEESVFAVIALSPSVRAFVAQGQVSAPLAIDAVKAHGDKAAERLRSGLETAKAAGKARLTK